MWSLFWPMRIKEMICVLYCSSDFITLEHWNFGRCVHKHSFWGLLEYMNLALSVDLFPKWDLLGVDAGHKVSFLTSWDLPKKFGVLWHHCCMCACICAYVSKHGPVSWYMSTWLGSFKSSWCGLVGFCWRELMFWVFVWGFCLFACLGWFGFLLLLFLNLPYVLWENSCEVCDF